MRDFVSTSADAHARGHEIGGVMRCCVESLFRVVLPPGSVPEGYYVPCAYGCAEPDGGMRWSGSVWRAAWIKNEENQDARR